MRYFLVVALGILPGASHAKTGWHVKHHPQTGDMVTEYYAAQIKVPVVTLADRPKTKTHATVMFLCGPGKFSLMGMQINLSFDDKPKFTTNRKRAGKISYWPAALGLRKRGLREPKMLEAQVYTWSKGSMLRPEYSLGLTSDSFLDTSELVALILEYDQLNIGILSKWDGQPVVIKVPLEGIVSATYKAMKRCGM